MAFQTFSGSLSDQDRYRPNTTTRRSLSASQPGSSSNSQAAQQEATTVLGRLASAYSPTLQGEQAASQVRTLVNSGRLSAADAQGLLGGISNTTRQGVRSDQLQNENELRSLAGRFSPETASQFSLADLQYAIQQGGLSDAEAQSIRGGIETNLREQTRAQQLQDSSEVRRLAGQYSPQDEAAFTQRDLSYLQENGLLGGADAGRLSENIAADAALGERQRVTRARAEALSFANNYNPQAYAQYARDDATFLGQDNPYVLGNIAYEESQRLNESLYQSADVNPNIWARQQLAQIDNAVRQGTMTPEEAVISRNITEQQRQQRFNQISQLSNTNNSPTIGSFDRNNPALLSNLQSAASPLNNYQKEALRNIARNSGNEAAVNLAMQYLNGGGGNGAMTGGAGQSTQPQSSFDPRSQNYGFSYSSFDPRNPRRGSFSSFG